MKAVVPGVMLLGEVRNFRMRFLSEVCKMSRSSPPYEGIGVKGSSSRWPHMYRNSSEDNTHIGRVSRKDIQCMNGEQDMYQEQYKYTDTCQTQ